MKNLPIVIFKINNRKRNGAYSLLLLTLAATFGFGALSHFLFMAHLKGFHLMGMFSFISFLLFIFSIWAIYRLKKDGDSGVIISDEGVTDLSTGYNIGVVQWKDIRRIKVMQDLESDRQYLVLEVNNPNSYIMQEPTSLKKRSLTLKMHYYGSPVCISTRALNCTFEQLETAVRLRYDNYKDSLNTPN